MADIAAIFHWPPDVMEAMPLAELLGHHTRAVERWNRMHGDGKS